MFRTQILVDALSHLIGQCVCEGGQGGEGGEGGGQGMCFGGTTGAMSMQRGEFVGMVVKYMRDDGTPHDGEVLMDNEEARESDSVGMDVLR